MHPRAREREPGQGGPASGSSRDAEGVKKAPEEEWTDERVDLVNDRVPALVRLDDLGIAAERHAPVRLGAQAHEATGPTPETRIGSMETEQKWTRRNLEESSELYRQEAWEKKTDKKT